MKTRIIAQCAAALAALCMSAAAMALPLAQFEGQYNLVSSTTEPDSSWRYTKGRIAIKKLDDRHVSILHACEWMKSPKEVCSQRYVAQWRSGAIYLQDRNTWHERMGFEPAARRLTVLTQGVDGTLRRDVYEATTAPLTDRALVRRMKREQDAVDDLIDEPAFGEFGKWEYRKNRIEVAR